MEEIDFLKKFVNKCASLLNIELKKKDIDKIFKYFKLPIKKKENSKTPTNSNIEYNHWLMRNVLGHKIDGYSIVVISLKPFGKPPGDANSKQMRKLAEISKIFSSGEIRVTHEQNLILPHVVNSNLYNIWLKLKTLGLSTPNIGLLTDTICCPGLDYCALATARSIPISQKIGNYFSDFSMQKNIGNIKIKISGCINACGHHHVGNIGILGLDKNGEESYQITLGGSATEDASIGKIIGPSLPEEKLLNAIEIIIDTYKKNRLNNNEDFLTVYRRIGIDAFRKELYGDNSERKN